MTDEQINQRIAEACGWRWDQGYRWKDSSGPSAFAWDIPDYCTDLNAMAEAERVLMQNYNWCIGEYEARLFSSVGEMNNVSSWRDVRLCFHATARQRAEAFLRTLGKWEEA
jgi:hypothetical protein